MATTSHPPPLTSPNTPSLWNGGENFYDGPHDDFCFVCGSTMSLISCQTCENCYHVECMSPTPSTIPDLWFCPHCTGRGWDVPPSFLDTSINAEGEYLTPISMPEIQGQQLCNQDSTGQQIECQDPDKARTERGEAGTTKRRFATALERSLFQVPTPEGVTDRVAKSGSSMKNTANASTKPSASQTTNANPNPPPTQLSTKRTHSPPPSPQPTARKPKRSKYSLFTPEIDKALAVLHRELEAASSTGRKERDLKERIRELEQEARVKEGMLALVKKGGGEVERLREENEGLKERIRKRDEELRELREWKVRVKGVLGE